MQKIFYIILIVTILIIASVCYFNKRVNNGEKKVIGNIREYSYITEEEELTEEYNVSNSDVVNYYSIGTIKSEEPHKHNNDILYYDSSGNPMFYTLIETSTGDINRPLWFDSGAIFKINDIDDNRERLNSADHIELFNNNDNISEAAIGWFDYRIVINAHIYSIKAGRITRSTINYNEKTILVSSGCSNIKYKEGYLYYLHKIPDEMNKTLYRIKLDGSMNEHEPVSNLQCFEYCLSNNGVLYLTEKEDIISLMYQENSVDDEIIKLYELKKEQYYVYRLTGEINNTVYLSTMYSQTIMDSRKIKIYTIKDDNLKLVHESTESANIRYFCPFVQGEYIYYNADGIYKFDPQKNTCTKVASFITGIGNIKHK